MTISLKTLLTKISGCCYVSGTANNWYYRKYADGTFEAWKTLSGTVSHYATSGNLYGYNVVNISLPAGLSIDADYQVHLDWKIGSGFSVSAGEVNSKTADKFNAYALSTAHDSQPYVLNIYVFGRWRSVGGVLRKLSIFKAFRHIASLLRKGGGVDDYKHENASGEDTVSTAGQRLEIHKRIRRHDQIPQEARSGVYRCKQHNNKHLGNSNAYCNIAGRLQTFRKAYRNCYIPVHLRCIYELYRRWKNSSGANCTGNQQSVFFNIVYSLVTLGRGWAV